MRHFNVTYNCDRCHGAFDPDLAGRFPYVAFPDVMRRKSGIQNPIARFSLHPWREDLAASPDAKHFCGISCALEATEVWLAAHPVATELDATSGQEEEGALIPDQSVDTVGSWGPTAVPLKSEGQP